MTARQTLRRTKTTEQNRIVRTGKSEAKVTNNKKTALDGSRYCTIEATKLTTDIHEASRGLFATAKLLVLKLGRAYQWDKKPSCRREICNSWATQPYQG